MNGTISLLLLIGTVRQHARGYSNPHSPNVLIILLQYFLHLLPPPISHFNQARTDGGDKDSRTWGRGRIDLGKMSTTTTSSSLRIYQKYLGSVVSTAVSSSSEMEAGRSRETVISAVKGKRVNILKMMLAYSPFILFKTKLYSKLLGKVTRILKTVIGKCQSTFSLCLVIRWRQKSSQRTLW